MAAAHFNLKQLFGAIESKRERRGLSWAAVGREVGVAPSTIRRFAMAEDAEADGVLALIRWLGAAPENYVDAAAAGEPLAPTGDGYVRVDIEKAAQVSGASGGEARARTRTTIQRLTAVALESGQSIASLTRVSDD